jgi:surface antigen
MTEREIPDGVGFLFGGMTDASIPQSAPPVLSEPENLPAAAQAPIAPVYASRREARAAGGFPMDAAAPALATPAAAPAVPAYDGIASLFPLLGDATSSPLTTDLAADLGATQAIPVAEVAAELATPVGPYVVPQSAPVAIVPSWHVVDHTAGRTVDGAAAFPAQASGPASAAAPADPFVTSRRVHVTAARTAGRPTGRPKQSSRGRANDLRAARAGSTNRRAAGRTGRSDADAKPLRQRIFGVGVMVAVGGLFAVLALPAYADNDVATLHAAAAVQTQKVAVANDAASTIKTTARDTYTATSAADLKSLYAAAMREQNIAAYLQSGAKAKGDDYPWFAELSRNQGGGLSPLGYYYRECVDFVAWRLNRDAGTTSAPFRWTWSKLTPNGGDGHQWKAAWLSHGWPTGSTPVPGAVAWFGNNHVGYVNGILDNGQVLIEEYNYVPHAYGTRVINASDAYYLYAPPN